MRIRSVNPSIVEISHSHYRSFFWGTKLVGAARDLRDNVSDKDRRPASRHAVATFACRRSVIEHLLSIEGAGKAVSLRSSPLIIPLRCHILTYLPLVLTVP